MIDADLLRRVAPRFRASFLHVVHEGHRAFEVSHIEELLREGRIDEADQAIATMIAVHRFSPFANDATHQVLFAGRDEAAPFARYGIVFSPASTETVDWLRSYELNLIRNLTVEARQSVRTALVLGVQTGRNPRDIARDMRSAIGLSEAQTRAVANYRAALETPQRDALERALRDRRYDPSVLRSIRDATPMPKQKIDTLVDRYYSRYLQYRAETIARTEATRATNAGAYLTWHQQVRSGRLPETAVRRHWVYTHDDRTRVAHRLIPAMNPDGRGLFEPFQTIDGPLLYPGDPFGPPEAVVNCRCVLTYKIDTRQLRQAA